MGTQTELPKLGLPKKLLRLALFVTGNALLWVFAGEHILSALAEFSAALPKGTLPSNESFLVILLPSGMYILAATEVCAAAAIFKKLKAFSETGLLYLLFLGFGATATISCGMLILKVTLPLSFTTAEITFQIARIMFIAFLCIGIIHERRRPQQ